MVGRLRNTVVEMNFLPNPLSYVPYGTIVNILNSRSLALISFPVRHICKQQQQLYVLKYDDRTFLYSMMSVL